MAHGEGSQNVMKVRGSFLVVGSNQGRDYERRKTIRWKKEKEKNEKRRKRKRKERRKKIKERRKRKERRKKKRKGRKEKKMRKNNRNEENQAWRERKKKRKMALIPVVPSVKVVSPRIKVGLLDESYTGLGFSPTPVPLNLRVVNGRVVQLQSWD